MACKDVKKVHLVAPEHAENVTVVACGNVLIQAIAPMVLLNGKQKKSDTLPPSTEIKMTDKSRITTDTLKKI